MANFTNKLNIDVNQFPSLTWNFLKINKTHLEAEVLSDADYEIFMPNDEISFKEESFDCLDSKIKTIKSGLGKEFDSAFDDFARNGKVVLFEIPENLKEESAVKITLNLASNEKKAKDFVILAGDSSEANFVFLCDSNKTESETLGLRIRVLAKNNSKVKVSFVNLLGDDAVNFVSVGSCVEDNASVDFTEIQLGGKKVYSGNHEKLCGYKSSFNGHTVYFAQKDSFVDLNYVAEQTGKESESFMFTDGVCGENAVKTWRGTINFIKGCVNSKGDEQENVLLLSPKVENKTLPVILCDEEDVEGRHGASIGKLSQDVRFYIQSRGIDEKEAERLMVLAKISSACRFISDEATVLKINEYVNKKFDL